jgi:uncharacterized membrane protein YbhN (UPF0104 family)
MKNKKITSLIKYLLKLIAGIALLIYALHKYDASVVFEQIRNSQKLWIITGILVLYCGVLVRSIKWKFLLDFFKQTSRVAVLFTIYLEASFINLFFPGFIAGDISRVARIAKDKKSSIAVAKSVFMDRFTGLSALIIYIGVISMTGVYQETTPFLTITLKIFYCLVGAVMCSYLISLTNTKITDALPSFVQKMIAVIVGNLTSFFANTKNNRVPAIGTLFVSFFYILMLILEAYAFSKAVGLEIPLTLLLIYTPLVAFASSLPFSILGIGVRENLYSILLAPYGYAESQLVAFALVSSAAIVAVNLSGGGLFLARSIFMKDKTEACTNT